MIDTKELRRLVQSVQAPAHNINERANAIHNLHDALPSGVVLELLDRLEAAESDALEQARLNGMGASREAALMVKLEAAEKEVAHIKEVEFPRKARAVAVGWETKCARLEQERDALRARIERMEKQGPVAVDINAFRSAFEAALKERNWPATRQGDGYLSPSTQSAWRIAFSTVRRLQLYLAPGAKGEGSHERTE